MTEIEASMGQLVDQVVDEVPAITGALVSSADGFVLASRLPRGDDIDVSAVAAMSAASLGLTDRLVRLTGDAPAACSHHRSGDGQVFVFAVAHVAVLTMLTDVTADPEQIRMIGHEVTSGLLRLLRGAARV